MRLSLKAIPPPAIHLPEKGVTSLGVGTCTPRPLGQAGLDAVRVDEPLRKGNHALLALGFQVYIDNLDPLTGWIISLARRHLGDAVLEAEALSREQDRAGLVGAIGSSFYGKGAREVCFCCWDDNERHDGVYVGSRNDCDPGWRLQRTVTRMGGQFFYARQAWNNVRMSHRKWKSTNEKRKLWRNKDFRGLGSRVRRAMLEKTSGPRGLPVLTT